MTTTDVELTQGQYDRLLQRTHPHACQQPRIHRLRQALDAALPLRANHRYATQMTDEDIESASYILKVAALQGGAAALQSNLFEHDYIQTQGLTPRVRLLRAHTAGLQIVEVRSNLPADYQPRHDNDPTPWTVHSPGLQQDFRLPDTDVHPRIPAEPHT